MEGGGAMVFDYDENVTSFLKSTMMTAMSDWSAESLAVSCSVVGVTMKFCCVNLLLTVFFSSSTQIDWCYFSLVWVDFRLASKLLFLG